MKLSEIKDLVEEATSVNILANSRKRHLVEARALFCELALMIRKDSIQSIAEYIGFTSHASVLNYQRNNFFTDSITYSWKRQRRELIDAIKLKLSEESKRQDTDVLRLIDETRVLAKNFERILSEKQKLIEQCLKMQ